MAQVKRIGAPRWLIPGPSATNISVSPTEI